MFTKHVVSVDVALIDMPRPFPTGATLQLGIIRARDKLRYRVTALGVPVYQSESGYRHGGLPFRCIGLLV